jgi:hypothetical protein
MFGRPRGFSRVQNRAGFRRRAVVVHKNSVRPGIGWRKTPANLLCAQQTILIPVQPVGPLRPKRTS